MTPFQEAKRIAKQIAVNKYEDMFVTISWGGEYINSYDVKADNGGKKEVLPDPSGTQGGAVL